MTDCLQNFIFLSINLPWWCSAKQQLQLYGKAAYVHISFLCINQGFFYFIAKESQNKQQI